MTQEAKVGAFTLAGVGLILALLLHFGSMHWESDKGYSIYVGFHKVFGIYPESKVMLSGVPVGTVKSVVNDGSGVMVTLKIKDGVRIPQDSTVAIESAGVMSEKFISILPNSDVTDYLHDGDYLVGVDETGMDTMFVELTKAVLQVQGLLTSVNDVIGNPQVKGAVVDMTLNIRDASAHIKGMTAAMEEMAQSNRGNVRLMVDNLTAVTAGMQRTMASVERTMSNVDSVLGDPQTATNLKLTLQNIADTSARVERIAENLEGALGDPQTAEDLKATVKNARELTAKADKMLGEVGSIEVTPSVGVMYSGAAHDWRTDFDLTVGVPEGAFLDVGVEDIGNNNRVNAQVGKRQGVLGVRGGVIAGKVGLGLDAYAGEKWKFSTDAYNLNDVTLRMRAQYEIMDNTYLLGELDDVTNRKERRTYVGLKRSF